MPRQNRFCPPHACYHVVNRGNDRRVIFREDADYQAFLTLLAAGQQIAPVQIFGYCLMPNHFHLLVKPATDTALSSYMEWVTGRYACHVRHQTRTRGHGHVFQRRFWSVPVEGRLAFLSVLRYIEANPSRANLTATAETWPWSSLAERCRSGRGLAGALPHALPSNWVTLVNLRQAEGVLTLIRQSLLPKPGRPRRTCGEQLEEARDATDADLSSIVKKEAAPFSSAPFSSSPER